MEDFFDRLSAVTGISKYSASEVITPKHIVSDMVDLLPADVFAPEARFLDPAVKSGRFLAELYRRLMDSPLMVQAFPDEQDRHEHILNNQLYGVATSGTAATIVRKQLYDDPTVAGNIVYIDRYLTLMADKGTDFRKLIEKEFGQMKFDVVIGNPPYQEITGGDGGNGSCSAKSIYQYFVTGAIKLSDAVVMIVNNSWMYKSVKIDKVELSQIIANFGIKDIINYPVMEEVFAGARVTPCIINLRKGAGASPIYQSVCNKQVVSKFRTMMNVDGIAVVTNEIEMNLLKKVDTTQNMSKVTYGNTAFNIATNYQPLGMNSECQAVIMEGTRAVSTTIDKEEFTDNHGILNQYKVICGRIINKNHIDDGIANNMIVNIHVIGPNWVSSGSFSVIGISNNRDEALNMAKYYRTKFCRAMLGIGVPFSVLCGKQRTSHIPYQNFTSNSDIDWLQSVADIDKQLYKKYGLTQDEIDYIEATIKPME